jgi:Tol biopolymer transport system component
LATLMAALALGAAPAQAQRFSDWSAPVNLGPTINIAGFNTQHPAISKDGLSLYLSSDRPGGFGQLDIWVSQRPSLDDSWGTPQNLGPNINSGARDLAPAFSPDGHYMYFQSDRAGGCGGLDLYVSHRRNSGSADLDARWVAEG